MQNTDDLDDTVCDQDLQETGILECATQHVAHFTSPDVPLCGRRKTTRDAQDDEKEEDLSSTATVLLPLFPSIPSLRGVPDLSKKTAMPTVENDTGAFSSSVAQHPRLRLVPGLVYPECATVRFTSIYSRVDEEEAAQAKDDALLKYVPLEDAKKLRVFARHERVVKHPVSTLCMQNAGLAVLHNSANSSHWSLYWGARWSNEDVDFPAAFKGLNPTNRHVKINHFPGTYAIGRKDNLCRHLQRASQRYSVAARSAAVVAEKALAEQPPPTTKEKLQQQHQQMKAQQQQQQQQHHDTTPNNNRQQQQASITSIVQQHQHPYSFAPVSYVLPNDLALLQRDMKVPNSVFIYKPAASSRGRGICLFRGVDGCPSADGASSSEDDDDDDSATSSETNSSDPDQRKRRRAKADAKKKLRKTASAAKKANKKPLKPRPLVPNDDDEASADSESSNSDDEKDTSIVVQRYIPNPLLIHGFKFDLRVYVLCTSFDPLRIYVYNEGLARFATEKYSLSPESLKQPYCHLTNFSVNKTNVAKFVKPTGSYSQQQQHESKWTLHALKRYFTSMGWDWDSAWRRVQSVVIKTLISCESDVATKVAQCVRRRETCFELYGFDVLIDDAFEAHLIEVNILPSLACGSALDKFIKGHLVADILTTVGVPVPREETTNNQPAKKESSQARATPAASSTTTSSNNAGGDRSIENFSSADPFMMKAQKLDKDWQRHVDTAADLFQNLAQADKNIIAASEEELRRCCGFQRVFPTPTSAEEYGFLFQQPFRYYNALLWRWEREKASARFQSELKKHDMTSQLATTANGDPSLVTMDDDMTSSSPPSVLPFRQRIIAWLRGEAEYPLVVEAKKKPQPKARRPSIPQPPPRSRITTPPRSQPATPPAQSEEDELAPSANKSPRGRTPPELRRAPSGSGASAAAAMRRQQQQQAKVHLAQVPVQQFSFIAVNPRSVV